MERQFCLRDPAMGPRPGTRPGPETLGGADVKLAKAVPAVIAGTFTPATAPGVAIKTSLRRPVIDVAFSGMDRRAWSDEPLDRGPEGSPPCRWAAGSPAWGS